MPKTDDSWEKKSYHGGAGVCGCPKHLAWRSTSLDIHEPVLSRRRSTLWCEFSIHRIPIGYTNILNWWNVAPLWLNTWSQYSCSEDGYCEWRLKRYTHLFARDVRTWNPFVPWSFQASRNFETSLDLPCAFLKAYLLASVKRSWGRCVSSWCSLRTCHLPSVVSRALA